MSGTTEWPDRSPAGQPPGARAPAGARGEASGADLVRLAQGFYFIFWGLLVTVLVAAQILMTVWLRMRVELMLLGGGVLATVVGTWRLRQTRFGHGCDPVAVRRWRRSVGGLWAAALMLAYFTVLFSLWRRLPAHPYLQANALGFVGCGLVYLLLLNGSVTALARVLGRQELATESQIFVVGNLVLLVAPLVGTSVYLVWQAVARRTNLLVEFHHLLANLNLFLLVLVLLPLSLTLSLVWAAKDLALRALAAATTVTKPLSKEATE